ncbi:MAG: polysaccharide deacetylase family protein [Candidatus Lokiarchaeota archaeon]|nr:polysaccharide deacetylase family protein [Candidatus Lokiarchaeota archaeon]MBD3202333.1 polysaccharide deacetylase family protein [Candidatus Lokiarchaeota archaeon]
MKISLTFDIERDNPNFLDTYKGLTEGLPKILKLLDDFKIKGTFFCTGFIARINSNVIRSIERRGHEIACHGLDHERLSKLNYSECKKIISRNREILQNLCESKIYGFRAPFLDPPQFLPSLLENLDFSYDSSFKKRRENYESANSILEFPPSQFSVFFRFPFGYQFLRKRIFQMDSIVLYFHPWEAINMRKLLNNETTAVDLIKKGLFRPDRWIHTGRKFLTNLRSFISDSIIKKINFLPLRDLC